MSDFVKNLLSASEDDFNKLTSEIEQREKELTAIREAHRIIGIRLGLVETRKFGGQRGKRKMGGGSEEIEQKEVPQPPAGTGRTEHYRKIVKEYLQANGPTPMADLSRKTGVPNGSMSAVLSSSIFVKTALGYGLKENHK